MFTQFRDGTLTDEDIDVLLRRGEERTSLDCEKIRTEMQHNLANFSVTLEESQEINLFTFEGEDFRSKKKSLGGGGGGEPFAFINLPQRERKKTFDVDSYFREAMSVRFLSKFFCFVFCLILFFTLGKCCNQQ